MSEKAKDPTMRLLQDKLREQMNNHADDVAVGSCQTFEEYKFITGTIQGLAMAERELLDLDEKLFTGD
ncbi:MAG: hypothetical protein ACYTCV_10165 [Planctomycetota bacterium]|jgi:hypothetical protein